MSKVITIISGKGGVGKTTTAVNLGNALHIYGKDVVVVDANLTTPNVGLHLGAPMVPISLNHVLLGKAKVSDAIYEHVSGTKIIPSSLSVRELKRLDYSKLKEVGKSLRKMADYIIYDSAAGLGDEATASIEAADEIVIVTNPEIPAVTDALKTVKLAEEMGKTVRGVIITRVSGSKGEMSIESVRDMLDLPVLGVIPEDKNVRCALSNRDSLMNNYPYSRAAKAYKKIAARIANIEYVEPSLFASMFSRR